MLGCFLWSRGKQATTTYQGKAQLPSRSQWKALPTTLDLLHGDRAEHTERVHSLTTISLTFEAVCISWWQAPPQGRAMKNSSIDSFTCSSPRKSLVKGERFVRFEGKPELPITHSIWHFVEIDPLMHMGHNINSPQQPRMRLHTVQVPIRRDPGIEALHYLLTPCKRGHDQFRRKC